MDTKSGSGEEGAGGDGAAIVILPGLLCDSRMFAGQVAALDAKVIDGFYGAAESIGAMAAYALERMPARSALVGHSMGARVALEIWRRAPERIARLALADTGVHLPREGEAAGRWRLRDLGRDHGDATLVDAWLPPMLGRRAAGDEALFSRLRAMAIDAGTATFERQATALLARPDVTALLPTIDCPTAVIVGDEDRWSPVEQHRAIAAAIPSARLRILPGAGHMAPAEDAAGFNAILRNWLDWSAARHTQNAMTNGRTNG